MSEGEAAVEAAEIEHVVESPLHAREPFRDAVEHFRTKKAVVTKPGSGTVAPKAAATSVEDIGIVHGGACAGQALWRQGGMRGVLAAPGLIARWALPPRCPGCGAVAEADHRFCGDCWKALRFLGPPWCTSCGEPFDYDRGTDARCGSCLDRPPLHDGARAAVAYGEVARRVALRLKYGGRTAFAETVARPMMRLLPHGAELLVPVPLHRWRLWSRGFNQAALIARAVSRATGVPTEPMLLERTRATPVLRGLGPRERAKAVGGAFRVVDRGKAAVHGKNVVLIDDVHTSGATADACTRALRKAGAARVSVLCWARVLSGEPHD